MSCILCKCGKTLGTSDSPSPFTLFIYYQEEVEKAIFDNPNIKLEDFINEWDAINQCQKVFMNRVESVDYWFCPECERVYEVQSHVGGHILRTYHRLSRPIHTLEELPWRKFFIFSESEIDSATEKDFNVKLAEYIHLFQRNTYFLSDDEKNILVYDNTNNKLLYEYQIEI